jgi:hypothetical protein
MPAERCGALVTQGHADHLGGGHGRIRATPAIMAARYGPQKGGRSVRPAAQAGWPATERNGMGL